MPQQASLKANTALPKARFSVLAFVVAVVLGVERGIQKALKKSFLLHFGGSVELVAQCFSFRSPTNKPITSMGFNPGLLLRSFKRGFFSAPFKPRRK